LSTTNDAGDVIETSTSYQEWKNTLLTDIDALPHTVAVGNEFVRRVLRSYYQLSEEDAINATACAGAGDRGVDAIHVIPAEDEGGRIEALVVQGKYGAAGTSLGVYEESQKFFSAVKEALAGASVTPAVEQAAGVIKNGGQIRYVVATIDPLDPGQSQDMDNVKKLAHVDFGDRMIVEAINLDDLYISLGMTKDAVVKRVLLACRVVAVPGDAYVGAASLIDMYAMLRSYAGQNNGSVNGIYDRNIRKYIKKRTGSVNDGIYHTLEDEPEHFIAFNNGITIVCDHAQPIDGGLELHNPFISNGCQTTRTLYDYMDTNFAGVPLNDPGNKMRDYREAFMALKVLAVGKNDANTDVYANNITRYSNKQNAVRGKDFIALEDLYRKLKGDLKAEGYFLETQTGEYDALPLSQRERYPRDTHVVNGFEATLAYAAGVLGKPYLAFGRSVDFTPGGREFEATVDGLTADDLLLPWLIVRRTRSLGYTNIAQRNPQPGTEYRGQTRYFFLFLFFRYLRRAMEQAKLTHDDKREMYRVLRALMADEAATMEENRDVRPFARLLALTDEAIATYMALAQAHHWYVDRNSFLKQTDLIDETHVIQATASSILKLPAIAQQIPGIMSAVQE